MDGERAGGRRENMGGAAAAASNRWLLSSSPLSSEGSDASTRRDGLDGATSIIMRRLVCRWRHARRLTGADSSSSTSSPPEPEPLPVEERAGRIWSIWASWSPDRCRDGGCRALDDVALMRAE
jgi:hypothetical protein